MHLYLGQKSQLLGYTLYQNVTILFKTIKKTYVLLHSVNNEMEKLLICSLFQSYFGSCARNLWKYGLFIYITYISTIMLSKSAENVLGHFFSTEKPNIVVYIPKVSLETDCFWHASKEDSYASMLENPLTTWLKSLTRCSCSCIYKLPDFARISHVLKPFFELKLKL